MGYEGPGTGYEGPRTGYEGPGTGYEGLGTEQLPLFNLHILGTTTVSRYSVE